MNTRNHALLGQCHMPKRRATPLVGFNRVGRAKIAVLLVHCLFIFVLGSFEVSATAATLFESGTLGATGVTWTDLQNQTVPGTNVNSGVFVGVRFELIQPVVTSRVGGHFAGPMAGEFFGALVKLDGANDFPDSTNLSTSDVLGVTSLIFPTPSTEVFGDLTLSLDSGWYALVFGSGLFDTSGFGGAVENGNDIGAPTYLSWQFGNSGWSVPINPLFRNYRFVVQGKSVPEPTAFVISFLALPLLLICRRRCSGCNGSI